MPAHHVSSDAAPTRPPHADRPDGARRSPFGTGARSVRHFSPESVLVCVDATPFADRLIRTGRGVATALDADLVVLHIDTSDIRRGSEMERQRLDDAFELAR